MGLVEVLRNVKKIEECCMNAVHSPRAGLNVLFVFYMLLINLQLLFIAVKMEIKE